MVFEDRRRQPLAPIVTSRRVLALQMGARRNYAAARYLDEAGLLYQLVCDIAWSAGRVPRVVAAVGRHRPSFAATLARRTIAGIDPARVHVTIVPALARLSARVTSPEHATEIADNVLGRTVPCGTLDHVDVVLSYLGNGGRFLDRAKAAGKVIVTDFISLPNHYGILDNERRRWPTWEDANSVADRRRYERRYAHLVRLSDIYLCPSASVAAALAELPGFAADKVRIVPYGSSGLAMKPAATQEGRVFFGASNISLAKGIFYLAEAARMLKRRGLAVQFVVAGRVDDGWRGRPELEGLELIGPVGQTRMADEFARADMFCLPSLSEGSATIVYEALANSLPVVTTAASGSVVTDGAEGRIVPECDAAALADAIASIVGDRPRRATMARAARAAAEHYSDARCSAMFIDVIHEALALAAQRNTAEPSGTQSLATDQRLLDLTNNTHRGRP